MAAIPKHKPKTWRENRGEEILKYRNEIAPKIVEKMLKEEEAKEIKEAERTDSWLRKKKKKFKRLKGRHKSGWRIAEFQFDKSWVSKSTTIAYNKDAAEEATKLISEFFNSTLKQ